MENSRTCISTHLEIRDHTERNQAFYLLLSEQVEILESEVAWMRNCFSRDFLQIHHVWEFPASYISTILYPLFRKKFCLSSS